MENLLHHQQTVQGLGWGGNGALAAPSCLGSTWPYPEVLTMGLEHAAAHRGWAAVGLPEEMIVGVVRGRAGWLDP